MLEAVLGSGNPARNRVDKNLLFLGLSSSGERDKKMSAVDMWCVENQAKFGE